MSDAEELLYLRIKLADAQHANRVLLGAIEGVCCGARTVEQLREWHEGPRK